MTNRRKVLRSRVASRLNKTRLVALAGLAGALVASSIAFAQQPQPQQPQPPQPTPQQQPNPQTPLPNGQTPNGQSNNGKPPQQPPTTALERAQADFSKLQQTAVASPITIGQVNVQPASVGDTVTFKIHVYDQTAATSTFLYALQGNPYGSYVDPNTGDFTWQPSVPGIYTFYVWAADSANPMRQAFQQVTITVNPALQPFGYSLFAKARAVIDTRMILLKAGLLQGVSPITGQQTSIPVTAGAPTAPITGAGGQSIFNATSPLFGGGSGSSLFSQGGGLVAQPFQPPIAPWGSLQNPLAGPTGTNPNQQYSNQQQGALSGPQSTLQNIQNMLNGGQAGGYQGYGGYGPGSSLLGPMGSMNAQQFGQFGQGQFGQGQIGQSPYGGMGGSQLGPPISPFGQSQTGSSGQAPNGNAPANPSQPGFSITTPNYQGLGSQSYGNGYGGLLNGQTPFASSGPTGLTFVPNNSFANLQGTFSMQQPNGLPGAMPGLSADALRYLVGPLEEMGMNVYLPYPERYQLGPGDLLTARIWSATVPSETYDLKVDDQGKILLPTDNEEITIRGRTLAQAETVLEARVEKLFKGGHLDLALKALRTMSIQILGDAYMPGSYQVPTVATLFNTLMVCGGPDDIGSLRKIQLKRNDGHQEFFDLYDYLTRGDTKADVPLQPGDVIFIPPVSTRLNIRGEVERPAIYEVLPTDSVAQLVKYAGGVTAVGVAQRAELDTEAPGIGHVVRDVDLNGATPEKFYDNDTLTVFPVQKDILDDIIVDGAVQEPGTYEYKNGITIADVIMKSGGLRPDAYTLRADLYRRNPDKTETLIPVDLEDALKRNAAANLALAPHDRIEVYHIADAIWQGNKQVTILGSVQKPGQYPRAVNERVEDLIFQAGGITGDAFKDVAILQRINPDHTNGPLIRIDLNKLLGDPAENIVLNDLDTLTIQSDKEAHFVPEQSVGILGAVQSPNTYPYATNMHLRDLLQEAGNAMPNAAPILQIQHALVSSTVPPVEVNLKDLLAGDPTANIALQAGDVVTLPEDSHILLHPRQIMVLGRVQHPGPYQIADGETLSEAVLQAGGLRKDAFIKGTQFYRDPKLLTTDSIKQLGQDVVSMLEFVAQDEFQRALASSDVKKVQLFQSNSNTTSIPLLGGTSATQTSSSGAVPPNIWNEQVVTPARPIDSLLTPTGDVGINLSAALMHHHSVADLEMKDGDIVIVPETPATVTVVGAVVVSSGIAFKPGETVAYYIRNAGGLTIDAAKDRLIDIHPGGLVQHVTLRTRVDLGDQIIVPTQVMAARLSDKNAEIDAVAKQVTAGAAILAIIAGLLHL